MKKLSLIIFSLFFSSQLLAQTTVTPSDKTIQKRLNWLTYVGHYKLSKNWGIQADVQFRMDEQLKFAYQSVYRAGVIRYIKPDLITVAGYGYITTQNATLNAYSKEHRIWEQVGYNHKPAGLNMTHRLRVEHRFVEKILAGNNGKVLSDGYRYGTRPRYLNRITFNITKKPEAKNVFYFAVQDEIFVNVGSNDINKNFFDQNRFLLTFGLFKDKHTRLELGYLNQLTNPQIGPNVMSHIVNVAVLQTLDFSSGE